MESVTLEGGRQVRIRPIRADDAQKLAAAYDRLSDETKYNRFFGVKPHLGASEVRYLTDVDGVDHHALAVTPAGEPEQIIAVGRYIRLRSDPSTAEFAVTVGDPYQGEGIGSELIRRLALAARAAGIEHIDAVMLAANVPAHRLMARLAGTLARAEHDGPVDAMHIDLAA
jgi:RimJ/RimL family protein N-acetyltransferase